MRPFFAMVRKELRAVAKERTIMIAVVIQLFLASFSSVIVIGLISYYDPESMGLLVRSSVKVGIVGHTGSRLIRFLRDSEVKVATAASPRDAEAAFQAGAIDAIIFLPEDAEGVVDMKLFLPESEARSTVILMVLKEPLTKYENYLREERDVHVRYSEIGGMPPTRYEFLYSSIIPILLFFPAFIAGSMVMDSTCEEFENHTLETLWAAPVSLNTLLSAKIAAALVLAVAQSTLWALLLRLNRIHMRQLPLVLLLAGLVAAINAVGSAIVATFFKDRERSQFTYSLFILIVVSATGFLNSSPITLMTRLATDDPFTGVGDIFPYFVALAGLLVLFLSTSHKLMTIKA